MFGLSFFESWLELGSFDEPCLWAACAFYAEQNK